jgi:phosphate transport system substrate-binding protein
VNHEADVLLAMRELRNIELQIAVEAGLGQLNLSRQMRILALDALVSVTSASSGVRSFAIGDLTAELAGTRSEFEIHLRTELDGQIQGFKDRLMRPFGLALDPPDVSHETVDALLESVVESEYGLTLVPIWCDKKHATASVDGPM